MQNPTLRWGDARSCYKGLTAQIIAFSRHRHHPKTLSKIVTDHKLVWTARRPYITPLPGEYIEGVRR